MFMLNALIYFFCQQLKDFIITGTVVAPNCFSHPRSVQPVFYVHTLFQPFSSQTKCICYLAVPQNLGKVHDYQTIVTILSLHQGC